MSALIDTLQSLSPVQRKAVLQLDPVGDRETGLNPTEHGCTTRTRLRLIPDLPPEAIPRILRALAKDLCAAFMNIRAYAFLLEADALDGGRSALDEALEAHDLLRFSRNFRVEIPKDAWRRAFADALLATHVETAQDIFHAMPTHDKGDTVRLLTCAIQAGDLHRACNAVWSIGREFTRAEKRLLSSAIALSHIGSPAEAAEEAFLGRHGSAADRKAYVRNIFLHPPSGFEEFVDYARRLRVPLRRADVLAFLSSDHCQPDERVEAASYLVKHGGGKRDQERLRRLQSEARAWAISKGIITQAERFGVQIAEPLMPEELLVFIRAKGNGTHSVRELQIIAWARDLLLARLQNPGVAAPPSPF